MEKDPNINPIWDAIMGPVTDLGVARCMALLLSFIIAGGSLFWAIG